MAKYIFYTDDGSTFAPNGNDVENLQILGIEDGKSEEDAIKNLFHNNDWILDPFAGSSTTGIAANLANRRFLGIDQEIDFLNISKNRKLEIENTKIATTYKQKLVGFERVKE